MHDHPIGRYSVPSLDELPEEMWARIVEVNDKLGFVPNVFWTLAHWPNEFRAFFAYIDALMLKEGGVTWPSRR